MTQTNRNNQSNNSSNRSQNREWRVVSSGTNHFFVPHWRVRCPMTNQRRTLLDIHAEYAADNGAEIYDAQNNLVDLDKVLKR